MIARERFLVLALCATVGWFYLWTTRSSGDPWNFGAEQGDYYNLLIDGWLDGQLHMKVEVPEALLRAANPYDPAQRPPGGLHDASFYHGKYFLYFGAAPVVALMLPFRVLTGVDLPMPVAILVFTFAGFLVSVGLWLPVRRRYFPDAKLWLVALGVLVLGGASMGPVIVRRANIWELPLSSGYFFAMLTLLAIYKSVHAEKRNKLLLAVASLSLGLAVASRPTYLFAAPALLTPAVWRWRSATWRGRAQWAAAAILPLAMVGLVLAAHNYARFGNPLEFGTKYMLGGANEAKARYFSAAYLGYNVDRYFVRAPEWLRYFPFIFQPPSGAQPSGYYGVEEVYGVLPGFLVLWFVPFAPLALWARPREERARLGVCLISVLLLAAGPALMLCCFWAAMARYQIDFLPSLVLLGAIGALALERVWRERALRAGQVLRCGLGMAIIGSVFFGVLQSLALYGNLRRLNPREFARVARVFNTPAFLWEKLTHAPHGPLDIELKLMPRPPGAREPLLSTGVGDREDRVFVVHETNGVRFGCTHDGSMERRSEVIPLDFTKTHQLHLEMGSLYPPEDDAFFADTDPHERVRLTRWWRIEVDGERVLSFYQRAHPASPATLRIGDAVLPRLGEARFSGEIIRVTRSSARSASREIAASGAPNDFTAVRLKAVFPANKTGAREPLVSAGDVGRGDFVLLEYLDAQHVRFGFDHWGKPTRFSEPVALVAAEAHTIEIALGSFGRDTGVRREAVAPVRIRLDGHVVWEFATKLYPIEPEDVFIGANPIGGTSNETSFTGAISSVEWIGTEGAMRK